LFYLLRALVTPDAVVFQSPYEFRPSRVRSVQPDLLVVRKLDIEPWGVSAPPLLVVEVVSPGSRVTDRATKRLFYEESGVGAYWLVDPLAATVTVLERDDGGALVEVAAAQGDQPVTVTRPFPVTVVPAALRLAPG
jgi:Uma2 family endonuclease